MINGEMYIIAMQLQQGSADALRIYACLNISRVICTVRRWSGPQMASFIIGGCSSRSLSLSFNLTSLLPSLPLTPLLAYAHFAFTADFWTPLLNSRLCPWIHFLWGGEFHNFSCATVMDRPDFRSTTLTCSRRRTATVVRWPLFLHRGPFCRRTINLPPCKFLSTISIRCLLKVNMNCDGI